MQVVFTILSFFVFQYNVEGWPSFKLFREGRPYEYVGPMEKEKLIVYMKEQEKSPSEEKTSYTSKYHLQHLSVNWIVFSVFYISNLLCVFGVRKQQDLQYTKFQIRSEIFVIWIFIFLSVCSLIEKVQHQSLLSRNCGTYLQMWDKGGMSTAYKNETTILKWPRPNLFG